MCLEALMLLTTLNSLSLSWCRHLQMHTQCLKHRSHTFPASLITRYQLSCCQKSFQPLNIRGKHECSFYDYYCRNKKCVCSSYRSRMKWIWNILCFLVFQILIQNWELKIALLVLDRIIVCDYYPLNWRNTGFYSWPNVCR